MKTKRIMTAALMLMLLLTLFSCSSSPSEPQAVIRKIAVAGGYSLSGIPTEVKDGTVITFPDAKINGHDYTATIANRPYSAGDPYTVKSDITINVLLSHEYTPWTNDGRTVHVRQCTVLGCSQIESGYHTFSNGSCTVCGYRSELFTISDTLHSDTETVMNHIADTDDPSNYLVNAGKITASVSSIILGENTYQEGDTITIDGKAVQAFSIEDGKLMIAAPLLWFSMLDQEKLKIGSEPFLLPETENTKLAVDSEKISWPNGENVLSALYEGNVISTVFNDQTYENFISIPFNDTDADTKFVFRVRNLYPDGTSQTSYLRDKEVISIYPFGQSTDHVSAEALKSIIEITAFCREGYGSTVLTFTDGKQEQRINPFDIMNGETVKIENKDSVMYSVVTNFMPGYALSEEYEGDEFKAEATVTNDLVWPETRSLGRSASAINVSKPVQKENGDIVWEGMYVYNGNAPEQKDMVEITEGELISGRDYDNGLLYLIDEDATEEDLKLINGILDLLYYSSDNLMSDHYIADEQALMKTEPSPKYLFPMKDQNGQEHKLFTIAIYDFGPEQSSTLGYFASSIYSQDISHNGYAVFCLNLASLKQQVKQNEDGSYDLSEAAKAFLSTFAHEYTHYLQVDGKFNNAYTTTVDLAHFLEEGLADYISLKQNGTFDTERGAYNAEYEYISELFSESTVYHPRSTEEKICNYGVGCMFWSYIEEKYQEYGGMDVVINLTRQDTDTLEAVERELKKPFNEVYEDFMLEVIAEALEVDEINGVKRKMKFPELYDVRSIYNEAMKDSEDESRFTNDVDKAEINATLGPMSFFIVRYKTIPNELTFTSDSTDAKCYLIYTD